jgi:uncharacterized damage-inducible protein DinB
MQTEQWQKSETQFMAAYDSLFRLLEKLDPQLLNTAMQEGKWSPGQTMAHVNLATIGSLQRAIKKVGSPDRLKTKSLSSRAYGWLLLLFLKSNIKFKAPSSTAEVPATIGFQELGASRETIQQLLDELKSAWSPELIHRNIFTHPTAGPIDMSTFYKFLLEHTLHHRRQIDSFLAKQHFLVK